MDDTLDELIIAVRADTGAFRRDIAGLRADAEGPLSDGFARASLTLERGLTNAVRSGRVGFDDLKRVALSAMAEIAASAIRSGIASLGQGGGGAQQGGGGLLSSITQIAAAFAGAPGRATGGPVSPGRPYRVGENGPEWFVPTSSGSVAAAGSGFGSSAGFGGAAPNITLNIRVNGDGGNAQTLQRSARHVAHAVRGALGN
jgi:hypothetical protein